MVTGIFGGLGSGKTLLASIIGINSHNKGQKVYANYDLRYAEKVNPIELLEFELENCSLILDEANTILDSRLNSNANRLLGYFILQSRKRNVNIYYTAQISGSVDLRMRLVTNRPIYAEKIDGGFRYKIYKNIELDTSVTFILPLKKALPFFDLYDTSEVIYPIDVYAGANIDIEMIKEIFKEAPTKKSFVVTLRSSNPFISGDMSATIYDYLKLGKEKIVRKILKLELGDRGGMASLSP